jgi:hypothetical protein
MIKKQQKWIALLAACTFMWLMQVSTMPVTAAGTTEQISSANSEQGPDYYEAVGHKTAPAKKKSMLPTILIGVGLVAVTAAVLFLFVLKSNYSIVGTWVITYGGETDTYTFVGTKDMGTYTTSGKLYMGTYGVASKDNILIVWTGWTSGYHIYTMYLSFAGKFDSKTKMSGTYQEANINGSFTGTWTAVKQ